jgi:hypothetical protein
VMKPADLHPSQAQFRSPAVADGEAKFASKGWRSPQWWPTLAGIAFAAFVALDLFRGDEHGGELASIVAASALIYLAAAALQKPSTAWSMFFVSVLVITAAKVGWVGIEATWILLAFAGMFFAYGWLHGPTRRADGLTRQTIAMGGFGAVAVVTLYVNDVASAYLVAAGLFAHAVWDVYHHWANKIVTRSLAEFCFVLDTLLAAVILIVTTWD